MFHVEQFDFKIVIVTFGKILTILAPAQGRQFTFVGNHALRCQLSVSSVVSRF